MNAALREPYTHWSAAGPDTGWHDTPANRQLVRAATNRIAWTDRPATVTQLHQAPARVLAAAIFFGRLNQLREAGSAELTLDAKPCTLIGLADDRNRYYLLELDNQTVYVLHESRSS